MWASKASSGSGETPMISAPRRLAAVLHPSAHVSEDPAHVVFLPFRRRADAIRTPCADARTQGSRGKGREGVQLTGSSRPVGTLGGLCQRVTALVCSTHHDCARRGTIRRMLRSVPTSSSARRRTWRLPSILPRSPDQIALAALLPDVMVSQEANTTSPGEGRVSRHPRGRSMRPRPWATSARSS
jgi:hypothetical protein